MKTEIRFPTVPLVLALTLLAAPAAADQCIFDDLIVDGSACIGFDCVCNSEVFSFDTLRLKENNLRITFIDTSVVPSFPSGDWQIRANESANGGANEFAVDWLGTTASNGSGVVSTPFAIEGNAPNNAVYVDDGGRVGFKTATPVVELHSRDGDTPTLRLEQDGSNGFVPQTWDVAGNETNFFIRDVTHGSTLPLRIRPDAPSNVIFIDVDGDVGFGTSSPVEDLHLLRTDADPTLFRIENTNAAAQVTGLRLDNSHAAQGWDFRVTGAGDFSISLQGSGVNEFVIDEATGDVIIANSLSKGGGGFKIDHPLDPENRYLEHSFVESPEMLNVYNGNVELDADGRGLVRLPEWFESLNRDFRYQLTPIGVPAPGLHVAREVVGTSFEIAGGSPGQLVSWQLTGVRRDAWAERHRIPVESWKPADQQGYYLHPEAFDLPPEKGIGAARVAAGDRTPAGGGRVAPR